MKNANLRINRSSEFTMPKEAGDENTSPLEGCARKGPRPVIDLYDVMNGDQFCWRAGVSESDRDAILQAMNDSRLGYRIGDVVLAYGNDWLSILTQASQDRRKAM